MKKWSKIVLGVVGAAALVSALSVTALAQGPMGGKGGRGGIFGRIGGGVAELLGLEQDALHEQLKDGATLEELAADQGLTLEELQAQSQAEKIAAVEEKLAAGDITQEQADALLERIENAPPGSPWKSARRSGRRARPSMWPIWPRRWA